jgi:hypothetical protein
MAWMWRYADESAQPVSVSDLEGAEDVFPSQSDAESWLGENWRELFAAGVTEVTLVEDERTEYAMPLTPAE